eukprot:Trichotokara_eunicae@DN2192_c0_g1_i1.p1
MTVLSAAVGHFLPIVVSKLYTHYASVLLFFFFGCRLVWESMTMETEEENEELKEAERELHVKNDGENGGRARDIEAATLPASETDDSRGPDDSTRGPSPRPVKVPHWLVRKLPHCWSPVLWQSLTLTFLAEWGDRSQIATIALAASRNVVGVTIGSVLGHGVCTGIAVMGGKYLATKISERAVSACGGLLFLVFAVGGVLSGP